MRYPLLALALIAAPALAQDPDALDPRGYFPLAVGNEWEYEVTLERPAGPFRPTDESRTEYLRYRVVGDQAGPEADRFALVKESFASDGRLLVRDTAAVRYDAESASVLALGTRSDGTTFEFPNPSFATDLDLREGEQGDQGWSTARLLARDEAEGSVPEFVWASLETVIAKEFFNLGGGFAIAVHGFGFTYDSFYPDGCSLFCDNDAASVTFAVVDGQTYGARAVGVEEQARAPVSVPLAVYPNPTTGRSTVEATPQSGAVVVVYDAVGRRVRSTALPASGTLDLDLTGLPPGLYLLRVGAQTGRVVVR